MARLKNIPELGELSFSDDCREQKRTKKASRTIDQNPYTKAHVQLKYGIFSYFLKKHFLSLNQDDCYILVSLICVSISFILLLLNIIQMALLAFFS